MNLDKLLNISCAYFNHLLVHEFPMNVLTAPECLWKGSRTMGILDAILMFSKGREPTLPQRPQRHLQ